MLMQDLGPLGMLILGSLIFCLMHWKGKKCKCKESKVYTHAMIENKITNLVYQSKCYERKRKKIYSPWGLVEEVTSNL